jgi:hypothetical protein
MRVVSRLVVGVAPWLFAFASSGCAAQLAEQNRLERELTEARDDAASQRARVNELEQRLAVIERDVAANKRTQTARDTPVLAKLDRLIRVNEQLLQRVPAPAPVVNASTPVESPLISTQPATNSDPSCGEGLSPAEQIERLVRRLHGGSGSSWRGGLSLEQSQALRVLLRRERELDARSPWQAW